MVGWRAAGINYVRYSQIAAQITRQCTKGTKAKVPPATLKITSWEDGKITPWKDGSIIVPMFDRFTKVRGELTERLLNKDCQECRIVGSASMAAIGGFVVYHSNAPYYKSHRGAQLAVRCIAAGFFYVSLARAIYLPPFEYLRGTIDRFPLRPSTTEK
ncbi:unnamed protein product, partial [Mesorhabditis belari]|uniref:Distal membrane-arm assembly complex protein 1-like domain-containing protein n=1 Tax=Mesorhabditis belari TaxID=2138241 RepID=A0AAF3FQS6_9BILA